MTRTQNIICVTIAITLCYNLFNLVLAIGQKSRDSIPLHYQFGEMQDDNAIFNPIVRIVGQKGFGFCTAWVVDKHYAVTAAHCINNNGRMNKETLKFYNENGLDTQVTAKVAAYDISTDLGLLYGDFHLIRPLKVDFNNDGFDRYKSDKYITCGYPLGQKHLSCTGFIPTNTDYFTIVGKSHLIPGMSGGPVINSAGVAVAVNTAVNEDVAIISPVQGFLGIFQLE